MADVCEKVSDCVSSSMVSEVVTIGLDGTLRTIRKFFEDSSFHHLLVLEKGKLVGVISDRDLGSHYTFTLGIFRPVYFN